MPAQSRLNDMSTGHGCFPPTSMVVTPVTKTFFNDILAGVVDGGCQFATHCCGPPCHDQSTRFPSSGASKTYIEGMPSARIGDAINCGDAIAEGSYNSFVE